MKYKDEEWLREAYKDNSIQEMADMIDCSTATIHKYMNEYDIERPDKHKPKGGKHTDKEWLREKYEDEKMSQNEIAEIAGVHKGTIKHWLDQHGIESRSKKEAINLSWENAEKRRQKVGERFAEIHRTLHPFVFTKKNGYVYAGSSDGQGGSEFVPIHRLLAVAEYGIDAVKDKVVHHKNKIKWDNRPQNIELMDAAEHSRHHALERGAEPPRWWEDE